jgi:hypothetical protein
MTTENTIATDDMRALIVAHPISGMIHESWSPANGRPRCNSRMKKVHHMVTLDRVLSAPDQMFCANCFGIARWVRDNAADGHFRLAI